MKTRLLLAALLLTFSSASMARGVPMDPGKWETTMTMEMSMMPGPKVQTDIRCITESELSPDNFQSVQDSPCEVSEFEIDGNDVSWSIACPMPGGSMTGNWSFTSGGDTVTGKGNLKGDMGGMAIEMNMSWEGKRIGDCD